MSHGETAHTPNTITYSITNTNFLRFLDLLLLDTVLPEDEVRSSTVLSVVEEGDHSIGVHGLTSVEVVVLEVGDNLLGVSLGSLLEGLDLIGLVLGEVGLDSLHVTLEVGEVRLLVETSGLESERVNDVVDGLDIGIGSVLGVLGGGVGSNVDVTIGNLDHGTVDLVDNAVNKLGLESIGAELIVGKDVLEC